MTRTRPAAGCRELAFHAAYAVGEAGEVALEDYARTVGRAGAAEVVRSGDGSSRVTGVHLCDAAAALSPDAIADIEDFARDLALGEGAGGLGWS